MKVGFLFIHSVTNINFVGRPNVAISLDPLFSYIQQLQATAERPVHYYPRTEDQPNMTAFVWSCSVIECETDEDITRLLSCCIFALSAFAISMMTISLGHLLSLLMLATRKSKSHFADHL